MPSKWFRRNKSKDPQGPTLPEGADLQQVDSAFEGLNLQDDAVYQKVKARHGHRSISTINTLLAIKSHRKRRKIVTHRIRRLKCLIAFLVIIAFILSLPYCYILYQIRRNARSKSVTLGVDFVYQHVNGTCMFEIAVSIVLFLVSILRVMFPKKENLYYMSHICYLFVVIHYCILIPLNGRNFWKSLSTLEEYMQDAMQTGRCYKLPVSTAVRSNFSTTIRRKDSRGCIIEEEKLDLPHIRFDVQKECDGEKTWFSTARVLIDGYGLTKKDSEYEKLIVDPDFIQSNGSYEVYSIEWANSQRRHKCCGIKNGRKDWYMSTRVDMYRSDEAQLLMEDLFIYPSSCCKPIDKNKKACVASEAFSATCTSFEQLTVISYSLSTLVTLVACGIFNFTIFVLLIRLRRMVERFRPDLLQLN